MYRLLALAVVVSTLATGCEETCDVRTVSVGWPTFNRADGVVTSSCSTAGASFIDVFIDGQFVTREDCTFGFVDISVFSGHHVWTVEGLNRQNQIVLRDSFVTDGDHCGTLFVDTQPAAGLVDLQYLFFQGGAPLPQPQQVCAPDSLLWLSIFDQTANDLAVLVDRNSSPTAFPCGGPLVLPLPIGDFTLDFMEERGPGPDFALESADCTPHTFTVVRGNGVNATPVPVDLAIDAPAACTRL